MSKVKPFFVTGASAKIKVNGRTLAFCTDLSYSVQIITQTPKVLGMYEGTSVEPLGYSVSGSFNIIRYVKNAKSSVGTNSTPSGTVAKNDAGNGVGNWGGTWGGDNQGSRDLFARLGIGNDGRANEALDPSRLENGTSFDIQIYQKVPNGQFASNGIQNAIRGATDVLAGGTDLGNRPSTDLIGVANIRNCRITQADFAISKRSLAMQRFSFVALYVDEDSFVADMSGVGQKFD